jgi:hypothetical protein
MTTQADIAAKAVIYGLPLVLMDLTRARMTNVETPQPSAAPLNQFAHAPAFPPADFKAVVRANVDTLYSSAFLDLSAEPMILTVPDTDGRYYLLPIMDAWTNVFASPGARTTGTGARDFVITGPGWSQTCIPEGVMEYRSPTNLAWILGRTQTNGPEDYAAVQAIQAGYKLTPLSQYGKSYVLPVGAVDVAADMRMPPVKQLMRMSGREFFVNLARLLKSNPPAMADALLLADFAAIGLVPGQDFDETKLDEALEGIVQTTIATLQSKSSQLVGPSLNGWRFPRPNIGAFGTDYEARAFIALIALAANLTEDAIYPTAYVDGNGQGLDGSNRYVLHFGPGMTPPVNAFWSVTLYDGQSFFVPNAISRQAISSWMTLDYNTDGSLDILIQSDAPAREKASNWLPAPEGEFNLTLRMYWPKSDGPSILDGSWSPPAIMKLD